jgi:hypothetical protein
MLLRARVRAMTAAGLTINFLMTIMWLLAANHCYVEAAFGLPCTSSESRSGDAHGHGERCTIAVGLTPHISQAIFQSSGEAPFDIDVLAGCQALRVPQIVVEGISLVAVPLFHQLSGRAPLAVKGAPNAPPAL